MCHPRFQLGAVAALLLAFAANAACAQDYLFSVPDLKMQVIVKPDASVRIIYDITFQNKPRAHVIDIVDIGTPHEGYRLGNVRASSEGVPLGDVRKSEYVSPGFEVHMGPKSILPGRSGTLHVEFDMPEMVYQDTTRSDYASLRITPTWFGKKYVIGTTKISVAVMLPPDIKPDEVLHQGLNFSEKAASDEYTMAGWHWPADRLTGPHMVALSFPKRDMDRVIKITRLGLLLKWFSESGRARIFMGIVFAVLFGFLFFRFSGGTGISVFVVLAVVAGFVFFKSPGLHLLSMPIVVVLIACNEWLLGQRKSRYMPPIAQVEGGGIKRGLTAPEAAVLLELPVAKVLSLVIFGMLKKGVLRQVQADPLIVEVDEAFQIREGQLLASEKDRARFYRQIGQKNGLVVHKYEHLFIYLLQNNPGKPAREINFSVPLKRLIERVVARMKGFDVSDTKEYYRSIIRRAVQQASAIGDIPQREQAIDRNFEWILMDEHYPTVFSYGRPYRPIWVRGAPFSGAGPAPATPAAAGTTSFGDVAASFAGWSENTMGSMASAIAPGSLGVSKPGGGFLDLSGADHVTGEFFQALAESSGSGGGGGGGGCACAGCACACACAGGGR